MKKVSNLQKNSSGGGYRSVFGTIFELEENFDQGPLNQPDAHASFMNSDIRCCLLDYSGLTLATFNSSLSWN